MIASVVVDAVVVVVVEVVVDVVVIAKKYSIWDGQLLRQILFSTWVW